jgi:putative pantetheine hydrolase
MIGCRPRTCGAAIRHAERVTPSPAPAGPLDAITDVAGVRVGHCTRDEPGWLTGVTVVVAPPGTVAGVDVRGAGPGTRETDVLDPRCGVDAVDAVVLSGGSAFGLGAADGALAELYGDGRGWPVGPNRHRVPVEADPHRPPVEADPHRPPVEPDPQRVPVVPSAILFDLGRAGTWLHYPGPPDGVAAYRAAAAGPVAVGSVGAGTGARAGGLRGGLGTASVVLRSGVTVGALVVVNAVGSPFGPDGRLYAAHLLQPGDGAVPEPDPDRVRAHWAARDAEEAELRAGTATTLAVVATDATLGKAGCQRLSEVAHDGLARALSPVHTRFDGDTVFALATGERLAVTGLDEVELQTAGADCVARAVVRAVLSATSVDRTADGGVALLSYRDALTDEGAVQDLA